MHRLLAAAAALLASPALAESAPTGECAAIDYLLSQARTQFPALDGVHFNRAECSLIRQEFKCEWGFPGDTFAAADEQASKLAKCTAAQSGARRLDGHRGEKAFQLNPETTVFIRGPEMRSGEWKLRLRILSTADWN